MKKLTYKALTVLTVVSMTATALTACRSSTTVPTSSVDNKDGVVVHIPSGGLYEEGDVSIEPVDAPEGADTQTYTISGNPYDITAPGEYFRLPVEMEIPYDPSLLPENRTEAEVFPVYYFEGIWYRADGEVDTQSKTIKVATLHNGLWDWAWDKIDNWAGPEKAFFCDNSNVENLRQARENAEQARLELLSTIEDAEMKVEEIDAPTDHLVDLVLDEMKREGVVLVLESLAEVFKGKTAIRFIFGGKSAVIHIGGTKIATLLSGGAAAIKVLGVTGAAIVFFEAKAIGETSAQIYRIASAYKRFKEAKALVWGLENGCQVLSMPPEYEQTLKEYYAAIPIDQTIDRPHELDLDFSLYQDPNDITGLLGLTPEERVNEGRHWYSFLGEDLCGPGFPDIEGAEFIITFSNDLVTIERIDTDEYYWKHTYQEIESNVYQQIDLDPKGNLTILIEFFINGFHLIRIEEGTNCGKYTWTLSQQ